LEITVNTKKFKEALRTIDTIFSRSQMRPKEGLTVSMKTEEENLVIEAAHGGLYIKTKVVLDSMEQEGKVTISAGNLQKLKFSAKTTDLKRVGRRLHFKSKIKGELEIAQASPIDAQIPEEIDFEFKIDTAALLRGVRAIGFTPTNLEKHLIAKVVQDGTKFAIMLNDSMRVAVYRTKVDALSNGEKIEMTVPLGFLVGMANRVEHNSIKVGSTESTIRMCAGNLDVYHPLRQEEIPDVAEYLESVYENDPRAEVSFDCSDMLEVLRNVSSISAGALDFNQAVRLTLDAENVEATLRMKSSIGEAQESFAVGAVEVNSENAVEISSRFAQEFLSLIKSGRTTLKIYENQAVFKALDEDITLLMAVFGE